VHLNAAFAIGARERGGHTSQASVPSSNPRTATTQQQEGQSETSIPEACASAHTSP
jgi:hypothetical protein